MLDDDPTIPVVHLDSTPMPRDKSLRTNHSCALCDVYGHYSHHCPDLPEYRIALFEMNNLDLETKNLTIEEILPSDLDLETTQLPIVEILPSDLDLETTQPTIEEIHPPVSSHSEEINTIYMISSAPTPSSTDLTTQTFRTDKEILEALTASDYPWDDMPRLDPTIIAHHIDTWPDVPTVRQKQRPIHL